MNGTADLTDAEWNSLCELRKGPLKKKIPPPHEITLVNLGFAKKIFGNVVVTDRGRRYHRDQ